MELIDTSGWPFWMVITVFAGTGLVIAVAGIIGFESLLVLIVYLAGSAVLFSQG